MVKGCWTVANRRRQCLQQKEKRMAELPHPYGAYERLQNHSRNKTRLDHEYWGTDAALEALLNEPPGGSVMQPADVERVVSTTARRERYRASLRATHAATEEPADEALLRASEARQIVEIIQGRVANDDWMLLQAVAEGEKYAVLAERRGVTPGSLRVKVYRLREELAAIAA
jgi:hypothetical protein